MSVKWQPLCLILSVLTSMLTIHFIDLLKIYMLNNSNKL